MKSIENRLNEALEALSKAGRRSQFDEKRKAGMSTETQLNLAESILGKSISTHYESTGAKAEATLVEFEEAYSKVKASGWLPRYKSLVRDGDSVETRLRVCQELFKETTPARIKKHNGAGDHFVEGSPFNSGIISEGGKTNDPYAKTDLLIREGYGNSALDERGNRVRYSPEQLRIAKGEKPSGYDTLSEGQKKEFDFARTIGLSEADSFKVVKITGGYGSGQSKGWAGRN